jgi:hypothetical protein
MSKISGFPVRISDEVTLAYVGSRWVVTCGGVAYGPFTHEHSEAVVWLYGHCSGPPEDDPVCPDGRRLVDHEILALEEGRDSDPHRNSSAHGMSGTVGPPPTLEDC